MSISTRMRIIFYTECPTTGGVSTVVEEIARGASARFDCEVVCQDNQALRSWGKKLGRHGIHVRYAALKNRADVLGCFELRTLRTIYRSFRKADIVHFHLHTTFSCLPAIFIARLAAGKPVITTEHYISQLRFIRNRRLILPLALLREILIAGKIAMKKLSLRHINCVVTVSKANQEFLVSRFGRQVGDKAISIPNGVDVESFAPAPSSSYEIEPPTITTIAGLNNQKGHEYLIRAIPLIKEHCPNAKFVFAGEGHLRTYLETLAQREGVSDTITFAGNVKDIRSLLARSTLIILPSLFEGMPVSILEAMAASKAVVATNVDGTAEVVIDGLTGFLVRARDPEQLAQKSVRLLNDRDLRETFGRNGQSRVRSVFSLERMVNNYLGLFSQTLRGATMSRDQS